MLPCRNVPFAHLRQRSFKIGREEIGIGRFFLKESSRGADKYEASDFFVAGFRHGGQGFVREAFLNGQLLFRRSSQKVGVR